MLPVMPPRQVPAHLAQQANARAVLQAGLPPRRMLAPGLAMPQIGPLRVPPPQMPVTRRPAPDKHAHIKGALEQGVIVRSILRQLAQQRAAAQHAAATETGDENPTGLPPGQMFDPRYPDPGPGPYPMTGDNHPSWGPPPAMTPRDINPIMGRQVRPIPMPQPPRTIPKQLLRTILQRARRM